jgi:hypothetical protein
MENNDTSNDTNSEGQVIVPDVVYGRIISDGSDGGEIEIENPVPLRHKMSVGEKTRRAMALKLAGASYMAIAQQLGYNDASAARKAVQRGMKASLQENAGELKRIHYSRLEHMLMLLWPDVNQRDLGAMSAALAVMDRMERLFGLNAADRIEVSSGRETVIVADGEKDSYIAALREAGKNLAMGVLSSSPNDTEDDGDDDDGEPA